MQTGQLTVTGKNFTSIILSGRPREVFVRFHKDGPFEHPEWHEHHHPCNPHHKDHLRWEIEDEDETSLEHSKLLHHHHNRQYYLVISWEVEAVREIDWVVLY